MKSPSTTEWTTKERRFLGANRLTDVRESGPMAPGTGGRASKTRPHEVQHGVPTRFNEQEQSLPQWTIGHLRLCPGHSLQNPPASWPAMMRGSGYRLEERLRSGRSKAAQSFHFLSEIEATFPRLPQAHTLRRAFEQLSPRWHPCSNGSGPAYFRVVQEIDSEEINRLQRLFWNYGLTPSDNHRGARRFMCIPVSLSALPALWVGRKH